MKGVINKAFKAADIAGLSNADNLKLLKETKIAAIKALQGELLLPDKFQDFSDESKESISQFINKLCGEYQKAIQSYNLPGFVSQFGGFSGNEIHSDYTAPSLNGFKIVMTNTTTSEGIKTEFTKEKREGTKLLKTEIPCGDAGLLKKEILKDSEVEPYMTAYLAKYEFAINPKFEGRYVFSQEKL
jgi:hypothetical protein